MQNGTYKVTHKQLNTEYRLVAYNGSLRLYTLAGAGKPLQFLRSLQESILNEFYTIGDMLPGDQNNYDLSWIVNGTEKERIRLGGKYSLAIYMKAKLRLTTHKTGLLIPVRVNA